MPRYFFNMLLGDELIRDPEGEQLRDPDHAWHVARTTIREILKTGGDQRLILPAVVVVTDEEGEIVLEFPFAEAIIEDTDVPASFFDDAGCFRLRTAPKILETAGQEGRRARWARIRTSNQGGFR